MTMQMLAWSEERVSTLKKLWKEGFSASQIARQLGNTTRNAVIGKVDRMKLGARVTPFRPRTSKKCRTREPKLTPLPIAPVNVSILDVTDFQCKAIVDSTEWGNAKCCGHPTTGPESRWCLGHEAMFFTLQDRKADAA